MIYRFGEYRLDTQRYELDCSGAPCKVEPKAFDLLVYLVRNCDRTVTRDELFEQVWKGELISDAVLSHHVMGARKAVGDDGRSQRLIKTVHGRGYRFVESVREYTPESDETALPDTPPPVRQPNVPVQSANEPFVQMVSRVDADVIDQGSLASQNILAESHVLGTVLCATLDNIPVLSEQLGLNALQRLRQTFFSLAQEVVQRYGGTLQFYGADGILVVFGVRDAQAGHAECGVSAALELCRCLGEAQFAAAVRLGLHTGPVALESLTGETPNLAVWLQYQAAPNTILASGATLQLVTDGMRGAEPVVIRIPGHADPITAYPIDALNS